MKEEFTISKNSSIFNQLERESTKNLLFCIVILLNFVSIFTRPQDTLEAIGDLKIPMILNALPIIIWCLSFQRNWTKQNFIMIFFVFIETLRTLIGKLVIEDFVINDFWQFHTLKGLALEIIGLALPITVYFANYQALKILLKTTIAVGIYLAIYALTHSGTGPGGFLGDENDMALALLFFLAYSFIFLTEAEISMFQKVFLSLVCFLIILGIVATASRGGFVGLICLLGYIFFRSQKKLIFIFLGMVIFLSILPFVPKSYITEIKSISETNTGTAEIRKHYWKLATKVFLDPRNTLTGVGLNNTSFNINRYETAEDLLNFPSAAGRVVHSLYFEILGDLGLWGIFIVSYLFLSSNRSNRRNYLLASELKDRLKVAHQRITKEDKTLDPLFEKSINSSYKQINLLQPFCLSVNVSLIAIFSAGAFISVTYYPFIWVAVGISSCLKIYSRKLLFATDQLLKHL